MVRLESGLAEGNEVVDVLVRYGPVNNSLSHPRIYMFAYLFGPFHALYVYLSRYVLYTLPHCALVLSNRSIAPHTVCLVYSLLYIT